VRPSGMYVVVCQTKDPPCSRGPEAEVGGLSGAAWQIRLPASGSRS
jgi:hypothetical protein